MQNCGLPEALFVGMQLAILTTPLSVSISWVASFSCEDTRFIKLDPYPYDFISISFSSIKDLSPNTDTLVFRDSI